MISALRFILLWLESGSALVSSSPSQLNILSYIFKAGGSMPRIAIPNLIENWSQPTSF